MTANQMISKLTWEEVDGRNEPDMRRVLRDVRMALQGAVRGGDPASIARAKEEAIDIAADWGVKLVEPGRAPTRRPIVA